MSPIADTRVPDTQEFFENQSQINAANVKRTYDEFQELSLEAARRSRLQFDQLSQVSLQALQNAVETANLVSKQAVRHSDIAIDNQWNPVSQGTGMNLTAGAIPANRSTDVAAAGVSATIPASSDVRIIDTVGQLTTQVAALAALVGQLVSANKPATAAA